MLIVVRVAAFAEVPGFGQCPRVQVMQNFDVSQFLGNWYLMCAYPDKFAFDAKCASTSFSWSRGEGISIFSKHVSFGKEKKFLGSATVIQPGVLGVTFPAAREFFLINFHDHISMILLLQQEPMRTTTF